MSHFACGADRRTADSRVETIARQALSISGHDLLPLRVWRHAAKNAGEETAICLNVSLRQGECTVNSEAKNKRNGQRILSNVQNNIHRHETPGAIARLSPHDRRERGLRTWSIL